MYEWHDVHYCDELTRAGHTVIDCNPVQLLGRKGSIAEYSDILVSAAKKIIKEPGPHLMVSNATDSTILSDAIDVLRKLGIACVNLSVDDLTVPFDVKKIGSHYDLCWTTYRGTEVQLKKYGCNVIYLPMAANPHVFKTNNDNRAHSLCFIGSCYGARANYIAKLTKAGIPMRVRGNGWLDTPYKNTHKLNNLNAKDVIDKLKLATEYARFPIGRKILAAAIKKRILLQDGSEVKQDISQVDIGRPLSSFSEMINFYASCSASLGVLECASTYLLKKPVVYYRLREFEAPMLGCAHIVCRVPELEESFAEDKEMIFYSSLEECVDKARYYLAPENYNICRAMGEKARKRAQREHTWLNRFSVLCNTLGIKI